MDEWPALNGSNGSARTSRPAAASCSLGTISSSRCQTTRDTQTPLGGSAWRARIHFSRTRLASRRRDRRWWSQTGSNRRPPACKAGALPTELWPLVGARPPSLKAATAGNLRCSKASLPTEAAAQRRLVGLGRFELPTSRLSSARSNQLSYRPIPGHQPSAVSDQESTARRNLITDF